MIPTTAIPDTRDKHGATSTSDEDTLNHFILKQWRLKHDDPFWTWLKANGYDSMPKLLAIHPSDFKNHDFIAWTDNDNVKHSLWYGNKTGRMRALQQFSTQKHQEGYDVSSNDFWLNLNDGEFSNFIHSSSFCTSWDPELPILNYPGIVSPRIAPKTFKPISYDSVRLDGVLHQELNLHGETVLYQPGSVDGEKLFDHPESFDIVLDQPEVFIEGRSYQGLLIDGQQVLYEYDPEISIVPRRLHPREPAVTLDATLTDYAVENNSVQSSKSDTANPWTLSLDSVSSFVVNSRESRDGEKLLDHAEASDGETLLDHTEYSDGEMLLDQVDSVDGEMFLDQPESIDLQNKEYQPRSSSSTAATSVEKPKPSATASDIEKPKSSASNTREKPKLSESTCIEHAKLYKPNSTVCADMENSLLLQSTCVEQEKLFELESAVGNEESTVGNDEDNPFLEPTVLADHKESVICIGKEDPFLLEPAAIRDCLSKPPTVRGDPSESTIDDDPLEPATICGNQLESAAIYGDQAKLHKPKFVAETEQENLYGPESTVTTDGERLFQPCQVLSAPVHPNQLEWERLRKSFAWLPKLEIQSSWFLSYRKIGQV